MAKNDASTLAELEVLGYEPDGQQWRKGSSWKSECAHCHKFCGKLSGNGNGPMLCDAC